MKLPTQKNKLLVIVGVGGLAVVGLYVYGTSAIGPMLRAASQLGQELSAKRQQLAAIERTIAQEASLRSEQERLTASLEELRRSLPLEQELPSAIEMLGSLATQTGVKIQTMFPQRSLDEVDDSGKAGKPGSALYKTIPIQIDAAAGFHQLGAFLGKVEASTQAIELKSLRISSNPKDPRRHEIKLILKVYFAASDVTRES